MKQGARGWGVVRGRALVAAVMLQAGCAAGGDGPRTIESPHPEQRAARGPIVVTLVVDQLAAWIVSERVPLLPKDGGFARLLAEGTYVREARYAHAATDTAPGHAALYTGFPPRGSGVTSNERIDDHGKALSFLSDPATHLVGPSGELAARGSSSAAFAAPTIADRLREASPDAVIISLSLKDRGAIPGGGKKPNAVIWFDPSEDVFVTSTAFAKALPDWARPLATHEALAAARSRPWTMLDPAWVAENAATGDDQAGEGAWPGMTSTFPHDIAAATKPSIAFRASPFADDAVLALADAAIRSPGFGDAPTLLAISLSSNDYVGHVYGPDSFEAWDDLMRIDRSIAHLFGELDDRFGRDGWAVVLSADHGVGPLPETRGSDRARPWCAPDARDRWARPCEPGVRVELGNLVPVLQTAAEKAAGHGAWVLGVADPYVRLSDAAKSLPPPLHAKLVAGIIDAMKAYPGIADAVDTSTLPAVCPPDADESPDALVCRAFRPGAGDIYFYARAGSFVDTDYVRGKGVNHGSPDLYDRDVAVLARAPGRIAAGKVVDEPESYLTFTRTVGALLGLPPRTSDDAGLDLSQPAP